MLGSAEVITLSTNLIIHYDVADVLGQAAKLVRILGAA